MMVTQQSIESKSHKYMDRRPVRDLPNTNALCYQLTAAAA